MTKLVEEINICLKEIGFLIPITILSLQNYRKIIKQVLFIMEFLRSLKISKIELLIDTDLNVLYNFVYRSFYNKTTQ